MVNWDLEVLHGQIMTWEGLSLCFDSLVSKNGNVLVELHV